MVSPGVRRLARWMLVVLVLAIAAGTATTGAGPHAGGKGAKRIPVPLADMARTHAEIVLVLGVMTLAMLYLLDHTRAPERVIGRARILLVVMVAQGVIGYTQYFTHLPALLVGVHVFGVTVLWTAMLWFYDGLSHHPLEADLDRATLVPVSPADRRPCPGRTAVDPVRYPVVIGPVSRVAGSGPGPAAAAGRGGRPTGDTDLRPDRPWLVIVWNDPINLMSYVTYVFQKLFGYSQGEGLPPHARRPPQGPGRGDLGTPGTGRARRLPAPRARAVGHHGTDVVSRRPRRGVP